MSSNIYKQKNIWSLTSDTTPRIKRSQQCKSLDKMKKFVRREYLVQLKTINLLKWPSG